MLHIFDSLRECTTISILLRLLLALFCGGLIGLEREYKRRPAGFRTHILICIGAAMAILTSQYIAEQLGQYTDITRIGAQVVAGVGFIGAGTIVATKQGRVRGLTTAAGLWTSAIVGLACGAGYFEGAVCVTALVLLTEVLFTKLESRMIAHRHEVDLCISYEGAEAMRDIIDYLHARKLRVTELELGKSARHEGTYVLLSVRMNRTLTIDRLEAELRGIDGTRSVEIL